MKGSDCGICFLNQPNMVEPRDKPVISPFISVFLILLYKMSLQTAELWPSSIAGTHPLGVGEQAVWPQFKWRDCDWAKAILAAVFSWLFYWMNNEVTIKK